MIIRPQEHRAENETKQDQSDSNLPWNNELRTSWLLSKTILEEGILKKLYHRSWEYLSECLF